MRPEIRATKPWVANIEFNRRELNIVARAAALIVDGSPIHPALKEEPDTTIQQLRNETRGWTNLKGRRINGMANVTLLPLALAIRELAEDVTKQGPYFDLAEGIEVVHKALGPRPTTSLAEDDIDRIVEGFASTIPYGLDGLVE